MTKLRLINVALSIVGIYQLSFIVAVGMFYRPSMKCRHAVDERQEEIQQPILPSTGVPRVFFISLTTSGGSLKYVEDIRTMYGVHGLDFVMLSNRSQVEKQIFHPNDVLFFQYLLHTDFSFWYITWMVRTYELRLIIPIHDRYFLSQLGSRSIDTTVHTADGELESDRRALLMLADNIIFPTEHIRDIYRAHIDLPTMIVVPHIDLKITGRRCLPKIDNKINIGVITEPSLTKGIDMIEKLMVTFADFTLNSVGIQFFSYVDFTPKSTIPNLVIREKYEENGIFADVENDQIHGLLFLNNHPETYSYAFTKGLFSGLPIFYSDMGGISERIKEVQTRHEMDEDWYTPTDNNNLESQFKVFLSRFSGFKTRECKLQSPDKLPIEVSKFYDTLFFEDSESILSRVESRYMEFSSAYSRIHEHIEPYAVYFPQFHQVAENDLNFFSGYTDLVNLVGAKLVDWDLWTPLKNVLGYYDLVQDKDIIPTQVKLARAHGLAGFLLYYYWFSHDTVTDENTVFTAVIDKFFENPLPGNFKVYFDWCNEGWTKNVAFGVSADKERVEISNQYTEADFVANFQNLVKYFKHENYRKFDNHPVFSVHHPELMAPAELLLLKSVGDRVSQLHGFAGIKLILNADPEPETPFYYYNMHPHYKSARAFSFIDNSKLPRRIDYQYYTDYYIEDRESSFDDERSINTAFVNFDNSVRFFAHDDNHTFGSLGTKKNFLTQSKSVSPARFGALLRKQFELYKFKHDPVKKIFIINAWNEWGEQMVLEPSNELGFVFLEAFQAALFHAFPKSFVTESKSNKTIRQRELAPKHIPK